MDNGRMNYPAVVVAGIVYWLVQAAWYTALSAQWLAAIGKTKEQLGQGGDSPVPYIVSLVCDIVLAYAIAWVVSRGSERSAARGVSVAALLWLGLVVTTMETNYIFERRPATLLAINGGSSLIGMLIMGAIVGGWRKKAKS
jgi:hypothetical protein